MALCDQLEASLRAQSASVRVDLIEVADSPVADLLLRVGLRS